MIPWSTYVITRYLSNENYSICKSRWSTCHFTWSPSLYLFNEYYRMCTSRWSPGQLKWYPRICSVIRKNKCTSRWSPCHLTWSLYFCLMNTIVCVHIDDPLAILGDIVRFFQWILQYYSIYTSRWSPGQLTLSPYICSNILKNICTAKWPPCHLTWSLYFYSMDTIVHVNIVDPLVIFRDLHISVP
jgi:hypothetical protein